jgi:hypothetical protein
LKTNISVMAASLLAFGAFGSCTANAPAPPDTAALAERFNDLVNSEKEQCMREQGFSSYSAESIEVDLSVRGTGSLAVYPMYLGLNGQAPVRNEPEIKTLTKSVVVFRGTSYRGCIEAAESTAQQKDKVGWDAHRKQIEASSNVGGNRTHPAWKPMKLKFQGCMAKQGFPDEQLFDPGMKALTPIVARVEKGMSLSELDALLAEEKVIVKALLKCEPDTTEMLKISEQVLIPTTLEPPNKP